MNLINEKKNYLIFSILVTLILGGSISPAFALTASANPASGTDNNSVGTVTWTSPGNILSSDNNYANALLSTSTTTSHYLLAKGFGFSIPSGATIDGITVSIEKSASHTNSITDFHVRLTKDGSGSIGNDKADNATKWGTTDATVNYGSASDLWGTTWSVSEINSANFGVLFAVQRSSGNPNPDALVDHIAVSVTYTPDTTAPTISSVTPASSSDRKSTRLNSSHMSESRMPSSA